MLDSVKWWLIPLTIGVVVAIAAFNIAALIAPYYIGTVLTRAVYMSYMGVVIVGVPVVLLVVGVMLLDHAYRGYAVVALIAAVAIFGAAFKPAWRSEWNATKASASNIEEINDQVPEWDIRPNLPQVRLDLARNLGETRGHLGVPTYIPNGETPGWCAPVTAEGAMGRIWTASIVCRSDVTGKVTRGDFAPETVGSLDGAWGSKLGNQVSTVDRGSIFHEDDIYGYLDQAGQPHLVVPVTKLGGPISHRHEIPAGVIVFDTQGNPTVRREVAAGDIPGPVMPISIAERVRASLNARDGIVAFDKPNRNPNAYEATNENGNVKVADPNADNPTELLLTRADGRVVYVTPLTPYGASGNVVAYLEVPADEVSADKIPDGTLYRLETPQASLQTVAQTIAALYDADLDWAEPGAGVDASNKARLFELTPSGENELTAVIGVGNRSLYRLTIDPTFSEDGTFGAICVEHYDTGNKVRCDDASDQPVPVGGLRGLAASSDSEPAAETATGEATHGEPETVDEPTPVTGTVDLSGVSTRALISELERRSQDGSL